MLNWNVFVIGYQISVTPTPTPTISLTSTPTPTPTPTISLTSTPTPTPTPTPTSGQSPINPLLVGVDEYLSVGNEEYLMFVDP
jgi:hypothetical protein